MGAWSLSHNPHRFPASPAFSTEGQKGLLGDSVIPLSIWISERVMCQEDMTFKTLTQLLILILYDSYCTQTFRKRVEFNKVIQGLHVCTYLPGPLHPRMYDRVSCGCFPGVAAHVHGTSGFSL